MKNVVIILVLLFSLTGMAQTQNTTTVEPTERIEVKASENVASKASATLKAKVLKLNHKKSNDIISIKAYRKSLNVKVSTKRLC
ncbi:hypothetical protein Q2T40_19855 [Winogradskyella maritima]|uniref:Uncharacterized protein n=1 Tax=Winogradskyella maritima TaxID=1517766 RepID=A0ABV8AEE1_9FLAO|nr:hypothetical protein [Winogradskyella maritima]